MTLSTDVYVLDEIDPAEVFRFCQGLLTKYDDPRHMPPEQQVTRGLNNDLGQGLPAWLMTKSNPDGTPLATAEQAAACTADCEPDDDYHYHAHACFMSIDFDTAYSYRDVRGWRSGDLHAAMVGELGDWLTAKGIRWQWRNEFTGEVHDGRDGLDELGPAGAEAGHWFATMALPAIAAHIAESSS